jgi:hypothetical protein
MYDAELERQRVALRAVTDEPRFRKALTIANPLVAGLLAGSGEPTPDGATARTGATARRLEATLFHYVMRAAGRPTPQGAWAGVALVTPTANDGTAHVGLSVMPTAERYDVTVNLAVFALILRALAGQPRYRHGYPLRLNPTLFSTEDGWRYEQDGVDGPTWAALPPHRLYATMIGYYQDGDARPADPLVEAIVDAAGGSAELRTQLERVVDAMIDRDILQPDLGLPDVSCDVWWALDHVAPRLLEADRAYWTEAIDRIHAACDRLGSGFGALDAAGVELGRRAIEHEVGRVWEWAGLRAPMPGPIVFLDLRLPYAVTWSDDLRASSTAVVREVLAFYAADGGAELYRRTSVQEIVDACDRQREVPLLSLLASDRLRWQGTLDFQRLTEDGDPDMAPDSRPGVFTRFPADVALNEQIQAQCRHWEDILEPVHDRSIFTLPPLPPAPGVRPGPGGAMLLPLAGEAEIWAGPGRPQPGLFAGRFVAVLTDADAAPLLEEMRDWASDGTWRTMAPVELVGKDGPCLNSALRPPLVPTQLAPHGRDSLSLRGVTLVLPPQGDRPLLRRGDPPELLVPLYNSSAGIGPGDPCSWLLFVLAMAHGWEFVSFGFPALPAERVRWGHLPRLRLPGGTVLSHERWTLDRELVARLASLRGAERYLAWQAEAERSHLPPLVHVRCGPAAHELLLRTDSPLAIRCLFDTLAADAPWLVLREVVGDPERWPVVDEAGRHYFAELAVTWYADDYASTLVTPELGNDAETS